MFTPQGHRPQPFLLLRKLRRDRVAGVFAFEDGAEFEFAGACVKLGTAIMRLATWAGKGRGGSGRILPVPARSAGREPAPDLIRGSG